MKLVYVNEIPISNIGIVGLLHNDIVIIRNQSDEGLKNVNHQDTDKMCHLLILVFEKLNLLFWAFLRYGTQVDFG